MKILGTDFSSKWINFEVDGKHYSVNFKDSFLKGTHSVSVWSGVDGRCYSEEKAKIRSVYPSFLKRIKEVILLIRLKIQFNKN